MKHKITLEEIEKQKLGFTIAIDGTIRKEMKQLSLVLDEGVVGFAVEHWKDRVCIGAWDYTCLNTAIRKYNEI